MESLPMFSVGDDFAEADFLLEAIDDFCALSRSGLSTVNERSVAGVPLPWLMFWTIMSTLMLASPMALKMRAATPGLSGTADERDFGLVFVERDAANDDAFHAFGFFFHNRSWVVV